MIHIDFETYSAAGYRWNPIKGRWAGLEGARSAGLPFVGAEVYASHPSTRVICLAWNEMLWRPGDPDPLSLWEHVRAGGLLAAWNSQFEWWVWEHCLARRGWPELPLDQIVDGMPRARAWGLPGSLAGAAAVMQLDVQKDKRGTQLIKKFCMPRTPTKTDDRMVHLAADFPVEAAEFEAYCLQDVTVETALHRALPPLSPYEQRVWQLDQEINARGIPIDVEAVDHACELLRQGGRVLDAEMLALTDGAVDSGTKVAKLLAWVNTRGAGMACMDSDAVDAALSERGSVSPKVVRALQIRLATSNTSTKKVWAFKNRALDGRLHGQFMFCGAERTARWSGKGIQPQNFPRPDAACDAPGGGKWGEAETDQFLEALACRDYVELQKRWPDPLSAMSASLRGLICARPGHDLIGSDYTAIEAVVLAELAGEQWRVDVFNGHGKIYETSAAMITGKTLEEYAAYKAEHKAHHPDRGLGKFAELASGYQGSVGAWLKFGAGPFFTPERCEQYRDEHQRYRRGGQYTLQEFAILKQVWAWREASPMVVKFWAGLEEAAQLAVKHPGGVRAYRSISYHMEHGTLYCTLPSGRRIAYHQARVGPGKFGDCIYYHGNTDRGWLELNTYGGKLTENVVQAVARDLLAHGMLNCDAAGYPIVLHIHDEIISEVLEGWGSVAEKERLMGDLPDWAAGWPVRAAGGWRGKRFRK